MAKITLKITDDTFPSTAIAEFNKKIKPSIKESPDFPLFYEQVKICIDDYCSRVNSISRAGTTIYIKKEITFHNLVVCIILESPKRKETFVDIVKNLVFKG
ncbi:hypothetical protein [Agitococcus lubricus]|uniref:Uncharacterized protein n=1 Tax=Agitococcus lubricus TaxID=1077255 RepID=A0A2T5IZM2_9GAMM|nr:hypothetical protein [Agitococcus lubricus]PTQ89482.1 hypothetical protein C8N29_10613 [Agitococcus lubricus]